MSSNINIPKEFLQKLENKVFLIADYKLFISIITITLACKINPIARAIMAAIGIIYVKVKKIKDFLIKKYNNIYYFSTTPFVETDNIITIVVSVVFIAGMLQIAHTIFKRRMKKLTLTTGAEHSLTNARVFSTVEPNVSFMSSSFKDPRVDIIPTIIAPTVIHIPPSDKTINLPWFCSINNNKILDSYKLPSLNQSTLDLMVQLPSNVSLDTYFGLALLDTARVLIRNGYNPQEKILIALIIILIILCGFLNRPLYHSNIHKRVMYFNYNNPNYMVIRGKKTLIEILRDFQKFFTGASSETKNIIVPPVKTDIQPKLPLTPPALNEHYNNLAATIKCIKENPENLPLAAILQMYSRGHVNLNTQVWQNAATQLKSQKLIKAPKMDILKYIKNPGKFSKELQEILVTNPNAIDEIVSLTQMPIQMDLRYCDKKVKKLIENLLKEDYQYTNNTNNTNPDVIWILPGKKAIALDIKRFTNIEKGLEYDEIHTILPKDAVQKTIFCIRKLENKLNQKETDNSEIVAKQEFLNKITQLTEDVNTENAEDMVKQYNQLIVENFQFLTKYNIRITLISLVGLENFNVTQEIINSHTKNYDDAQKNDVFGQMVKRVKTQENDREQLRQKIMHLATQKPLPLDEPAKKDILDTKKPVAKKYKPETQQKKEDKILDEKRMTYNENSIVNALIKESQKKNNEDDIP